MSVRSVSETISEDYSDPHLKKRSSDSAFVNLEHHVKNKMREVNDKVEELKKKVIASKEVRKVTQQFEGFMEKRENPDFLMTLDEFSFSFGVLSIFLTFALLFYPDTRVLAIWITAINVILILVRFIDYRRKSWHYYYFDYCYYVNFASWIYLWAFPKNEKLFFMVFMNTMGPLLNYFVIFSPKLIYQSREAVTSFFMHYTPSLLFWVLRYYNNGQFTDRFIPAQELEKYLTDGGWRSQLEVFLLGLGFYVLWTVFYYVFIFHIRKERIKSRNYPTLFSYTVGDLKKFNKLILRFGEKWAPLTYMSLHLAQGLIGNLVSILLVNFKYFTVLALIGYVTIPIWNSSVYYFEYFSRDYNTKLHTRAEEIKTKRLKRPVSAGGTLQQSPKSTTTEETEKKPKDK